LPVKECDLASIAVRTRGEAIELAIPKKRGSMKAGESHRPRLWDDCDVVRDLLQKANSRRLMERRWAPACMLHSSEMIQKNMIMVKLLALPQVTCPTTSKNLLVDRSPPKTAAKV